MTSTLRKLRIPIALLAIVLITLAIARCSGPPRHGKWFEEHRNSALVTATPVTISFDSVGAGNTAALQTGVNLEGAVLSIKTNVPGGNARVIIHGFAEDSPMPAAEPLFTASNYGAGNPRFVIETGESAFYFDYPKGSTGCAAGDCWFLNTSSTPMNYATAAAQINAQGGVNEAWVVADTGGQGHGLPYSTVITNLTWNGQSLLPVKVANRLTAQDCGGPASDRVWKVTDVAGGPSVTFGYWSLVLGKYVFDGQSTVTLGHSTVIFVHRPRGTSLGLRYSNGLTTPKVFSTFAAVPVHC